MDDKPFQAYAGSNPYFFVCYAHDDAALVYPEMTWLHAAKFNLWYDDGIHVGTMWRQAIADAVADSSALIFFATKKSVVSDNCLREINFALDDQKTVYVVQLEETTMPRQLRLSLSDRQTLVRSAFDESTYRSRLTHALGMLQGKRSNDGNQAAQEAGAFVMGHARQSRSTMQSPDFSRIAVFPFANSGGDESTEYFSDGLTDELINALAQVKDLHVVSRTSVFEFKNKPTDIRAFGERLRATVVLEGSVRSVGDQVRVTAQLTNVVDGFSLWSGRFDREISDIFTIQDEITRSIVDALQLTIKMAPARRATARPGGLVEAYDLYLKGTYNWNRQTEDGLQQALQLFEESIQLDPDLAVAHAGLAEVYTSLGFHGFVPTEEALPKARDAARRALKIDHALPDANISIALSMIFLDRDWMRAETYLHRAIELNPSSAKAYYFYAAFLLQQAHFEQARVANQTAIELDPLNVLNYTAAGWAEYYAGRPEIAIETLEYALDVDPDYPEIQVALSAAYEQLGNYEKAVQHAEKAADTYGDDPLVLAFRGAVYGAAGKHEKADTILRKLHDISTQRYVPATFRALVYMGLRNKEKALEFLESGVEARDAFLSWINVLPIAQWLREDPRFVELLTKLGFKT